MWLSFKSKDFLMSHMEVENPQKLDSHVHKYYEFLRFIDGDASYIIGSKTFMLEKGDIIITRPDKLHTISFNTDSDYIRTFIQLSPGMLSRIPSGLVRSLTSGRAADVHIIHRETAEQCGLYRYFDEGIRLLSDRTEKNKFLAELLFLEFAVAVNEAMELERKASGSTEENHTIARIKKYIDDNYTSELNLDELARVFFMSKYYLCHLFKEETGITISDYIALKRIGAVREHIHAGSVITDIYRKCGFNDYSSFYRTVKKYTGLKPSEFYDQGGNAQ
ncbi:MAG: AraC family transcriptional regulator [Candidatus Ornithomonoglobus sp.]